MRLMKRKVPTLLGGKTVLPEMMTTMIGILWFWDQSLVCKMDGLHESIGWIICRESYLQKLFT